MKKKRSNGTGSIVKRENGMFYYWWTDAKGKRHAKSLRTRNREKAKEEAAKFERGVQAKDRADVIHEAAKARQIIRRELPLSDVWKAYLDTKPTCSEGTQENHKRHLTRFIEWLGNHYSTVSSFTQVSEDIAQEYAAHLWQSGMAAATFNYHRASLLAITNAIGRKYGIDRNPWQSTERKNDEQQPRKTMTTTEVNKLLENAGNDAELYTLLMLGAYAGMRLKDAALLRWSSVDLSQGMIEYRPHKTRRRNKVATVPTTNDLLKALNGLDKSTEYVLPQIADLYHNDYDHFKKSLVEVVRTVSPDHDHKGTMQKKQTRTAAGFHALRHYFCSTCANKGIPAAQLERMTGDQAKTLGKYYVKGEIDAEAVSAALTAPKAIEPEREQLHRMADELPIEAIQAILKEAKAKEEVTNDQEH